MAIKSFACGATTASTPTSPPTAAGFQRNGYYLCVRFAWNLAYRITELLFEEQSSGYDLFRINYLEDDQGRITKRDFSYAYSSSVKDAYYTYDRLNRVTCDSAGFGACPTLSPQSNIRRIETLPDR